MVLPSVVKGGQQGARTVNRGALFRRDALPWDAAFLTGWVFRLYRRRGAQKRSPMPDFYIGAHAAARGANIITCSPRHFQHYFPRLNVIAPQ